MNELPCERCGELFQPCRPGAAVCAGCLDLTIQRQGGGDWFEEIKTDRASGRRVSWGTVGDLIVEVDRLRAELAKVNADEDTENHSGGRKEVLNGTCGDEDRST